MIPPRPLLPAKPAFLADGTLYSPLYDDIYASAAGGLAETRHVFLGGNDLPERWRGCRRFVVIETGFGAGLNFLATWAAWRQTAPSTAQLHYISVEKHPFCASDVARVVTWPEVTPLASELLAQYPLLLPGFQRMHFDGGRVALTLLFGEAVPMLRQLRARADAFYLDGFAPAKNPDMWSTDLFAELARLARPGATAATYTVAGSVRNALAAAGFTVVRRTGFGPKREMLVARFREDVQAEPDGVRSTQALVIGAGLAGTSCAAQLARRGWQVQMIERRHAPAQEASGNPAGLAIPAFSADWNPPTRLTVPALLYAARWLNGLGRAGGHAPSWTQSGVLQLPRDAAHLERQQQIIETFALPQELVQLVSAAQGAALCGARIAGPGWWLASAGWADPASVCAANLAACGEALHREFGREVASVRRAEGEWEVLDATGMVLGRAPVVILANAQAACALPGCERLPLAAVRGQVSLVPEAPSRRLAMPVCRDGFVTPALGGAHCLGATYDAGCDDAQPREADHAANLERLEQLLPGFGAGLKPSSLRGRVGFRAVTPDRLPLAGALPHAAGEGLFVCLGLGSRGLTWSPLLGEIVACCVTGEPPPIERDVLKWLAPVRSLSRGAALPQAAAGAR